MSHIQYEKGIHKHWIETVKKERINHSESVITKIKERFERGVITESQLINWGREFASCPHAFVETLLYYGVEFD
jgi:hypothetical protein